MPSIFEHSSKWNKNWIDLRHYYLLPTKVPLHHKKQCPTTCSSSLSNLFLRVKFKHLNKINFDFFFWPLQSLQSHPNLYFFDNFHVYLWLYHIVQFNLLIQDFNTHQNPILRLLFVQKFIIYLEKSLILGAF